MAIKTDSANTVRTENILKGIGSIIDFGIYVPISAARQPHVGRTIKQVNNGRTAPTEVKISDLITVERATVAGGKVLFEGVAVDGSMAVRQRKVKPGERILLRGKLTASGQLQDVVVVSGSGGVSALSDGRPVVARRAQDAQVRG